MSRFSTIFFDFDGTIGDTELDIRNAWHAGIAKLGLKCDHFDAVFRVGPTLPDTAKALFPDADAQLLHEIQEAYKSFYDDADDYSAQPYPGIIEMIRQFHDDGGRFFVVTNKRLKPARKLLIKFGIDKICAGLFTPDIVAPDRQLYKFDLVRAALNVSCAPSPAGVLMVGDTEIDIAAGKASGLSTCGVTWGCCSPEDIAAAQPDFIVNKAEEILYL